MESVRIQIRNAMFKVREIINKEISHKVHEKMVIKIYWKVLMAIGARYIVDNVKRSLGDDEDNVVEFFNVVGMLDDTKDGWK